jgi:hypothetical protein
MFVQKLSHGSILMPSASPVRCRQIREADLAAVADLLKRGFPTSPRNYWTTAFRRLRAHRPPEGCPRFGYLLEAEGRIVGVLMLIFSQAGATAPIRCNVSSWYVEPEFRGFASALARAAQKLKHVTYSNISPAPHTVPILEAQGYRLYSQGQFAAAPALRWGPAGARARMFRAEARDRDLPEFDLLVAHAEAGCIVAVCDLDGERQPFVFVRRRLTPARLGVAQLAYCRDTETFVRCAGPLGRLLLARGYLGVLCDADAPIEGLPGVLFRDKAPRFFKGPDRPPLNDLTFTELVLFGG